MGGFECERVDMKWLALCTDGSTGRDQKRVNRTSKRFGTASVCKPVIKNDLVCLLACKAVFTLKVWQVLHFRHQDTILSTLSRVRYNNLRKLERGYKKT